MAAVLAFLAGAASASVTDDAPTLKRFHQARFAATLSTGGFDAVSGADVGTDLQPVQLPHVWRGGPAPGVGRHRFEFTWLPTQQDLAVLLEATTVHVTVFLNGQEVGHTAADPYAAPPLRSWKASPRFSLPAILLRTGFNTLEVASHVAPSGAAGLGPVWIGASAAIDRAELRILLRDTIAPLVIAAVIITLGLFALVLARNQPDRSLFILFGVGALVWGVHTAVTLLPEQPLPNPHYRSLWYAGYVWFVVALSVFCTRFAERRWRPFERVGIAAAVLALPLMYLLSAMRAPGIAYGLVLAGCIVYALVALSAVVRFAVERRDIDGWLLLMVAFVSLGFSIYDWVLNNVLQQLLKAFFLTPYAGLAFIVLAGWILVERYQRTANAYRRLSLDLERRVRAAQSELLERLDEVQHARDIAERASRSKSRFFAAASHDLRQPLHALSMYTDALGEHLRSGQGAELLRRIGESVGALDRLFGELLDLSRLDAGVIDVKAAPVDLQALFDRLDALFARDAQDKGLHLRFVPTTRRVLTDGVLLERILSNLIANAIRYTNVGGVLVGARRWHGRRVSLEVRDTGIGIPADEQDRVFDEFYQIGNPARDRRMGFGLGLAIVRRLARLLGHRLELWSVPGRGTRFRLIVPTTEAVPQPAATDAPRLDGELFRGKRVLVVDDDADIRDATVRVLGRWGIQVTAVAGPGEAQRAVGEGAAPDLVIADLRLGATIDGLDVIQSLRERCGPTLPALLVSGDTGARELARVQASGVPLMIKPVAPARLRAALHAAWSPERDAAATAH